MSLNDGLDASRYMDTGSTSHFTSNTCNLFSVQINSHKKFVFVGSGHSIPVTDIGYSKIVSTHRPLHLHTILVTPNIIKILVLYIALQLKILFPLILILMGLLWRIWALFRSCLGVTILVIFTLLLHLFKLLLLSFLAVRYGISVSVILALMSSIT